MLQTLHPIKSFLTSDLLREARTRALEMKKKKLTPAETAVKANKPTEKKSVPKRNEAPEVAPPAKINFSSESNLSEELQEFKEDLINGTDTQNNSASTSYVPETSSGKDIIKIRCTISHYLLISEIISLKRRTS